MLLLILLLAFLSGTAAAASPPDTEAASVSARPAVPHDSGAEEALLSQARLELWAGRETAAVPLFRQYLGRRPDDREARLDLARALAWSGRLRESMKTYRMLDSEHPGDADVLSGMGDLLAWSGRPYEALALYRRALSIDPGREATRAPAAGLAGQEGMVVSGESGRFHDSGGTLANSFHAVIGPGEAGRGGPVLHLLREEISRIGGDAGPAVRTNGACAGWDAQLAGGLRMKALIGATRTGDDAARTWSEMRVSVRTLRRFSLDLNHTFRDRGHDLSSLEARRRGLTGHEISLSGYRSFSAESGLFARARGGSISDGNAYRGGDLAFDATVVKRQDARVISRARAIVSLYAKDFDTTSEMYYAALNEWSAAAGVRVTLYRDERLDLEASGRGGVSGNESAVGGASGRRSGRGEVLGAGVTASWSFSPAMVIEGGFSYDQTIQTSTYIRRAWQLGLRWRV